MWKLFDSGKKSAQKNMELDSELLDQLDPGGQAILHFYDWQEPSFTHGYFVDPKNFLDLIKVKDRGMSWAKRPTGGGIVFHTSDLAFSVLIPALHPGFCTSTLNNYQYVNEKVARAVKGLIEESGLILLPEEARPVNENCPYFCMAKPTIFDVMLDGKKIAGAAQRKRKQGFLHQGTISIASPDYLLLEEILLPQTKVIESMKMHTYPLLRGSWSPGDLQEMRECLKKHLKKVFLEN